MALVPPVAQQSRSAPLCNTAVTSPAWLVMLKFSDIKIELPSCASHTARA